MRRVSAIFLCLLSPLLLHAQAENRQAEKGRVETSVNFGAKAGFTSAMILVDKLQMEGTRVDEEQHHFRIGYFASLFMRINFDRHFIQPEFSYNVNRSSINFDRPNKLNAEEETGATTAFVNSSIHSIDMPIIYGYNIVKEEPYSLAVFGGPKLRYIWRHKSEVEFGNFTQTAVKETLHPFGASFTLGVAVTISRVFFDFRYDIGIINLAKRVTYEGMEADETPLVAFKHRENALSFSLGVFF